MRFEGWIFIMVVSKPKKPAGNLHWQWWRKRKKKKRLYVVKGKLQYHGDERQHLRYEGGSGIWGQGHTVGPNDKILSEIKLKKKSVKLIDHTYACNSLTYFECEDHPFTGYGNVQSFFEKIVKSHQTNWIEYMSGGL